MEIIDNSKIPIGANQIKNELLKIGINISEATVGRMLLELDQEGVTQKEGFKGRVLTTQGFQELKQMQMQHDRMEYGEEFFKILDSKSKKELVDVLIARKAIEREMARLAAQNITPKLAREMKEVLKLQNLANHKENNHQYDALFHELIARAADNKVLEMMLQIIRQDIELAPALEYIRKKVNGVLTMDHIKIMEAIINKDSEQAEVAMVEHLDNLIKDINKFWMTKGYFTDS